LGERKKNRPKPGESLCQIFTKGKAKSILPRAIYGMQRVFVRGIIRKPDQNNKKGHAEWGESELGSVGRKIKGGWVVSKQICKSKASAYREGG